MWSGRLRWAVVGGLMALAALAQTFPRPWNNAFAAGARALCGVVALGACAARWRRNGEEAPVWALVAIGLGLFIAGDVLAFHAFLRPGSLAMPQWLSTLLLHLLPIPFLIAALLRWNRLRRPGPEGSLTHALLDGVLFGYASFFLIWVMGIRLWQGATRDSDASASLVARFALLGVLMGTCVFLGSRKAARWRGPLAWFGGAFLLLTLASGLSAASLLGGQGPVFRVISNLLKPAALLLLAGAAWSPQALEASRENDRATALARALRDHLPYVPAVLATLGSFVLAWPSGVPLDARIVLYGAPVLALLLVRQFLAFQDLKAFSRDLESKVAARTQALEATQAVAMRTERMNALAMLGAGLAHDLNNALSTIRATAELIADEAVNGRPGSPRHLDRLLVASDQAAGLSRRMMAYGREDEPAERIELQQELQRMEDLLRILLPRRILLRMTLGDASCLVAASRSQLEQVLVNLVSNARDAIEAGGVITIELRREDGHAVVRIQDTGCGIPAEVIGRIFEPFYTTKPEGRGTGLGLPSVKSLVERAGGRIEVDSHPGLGTAFTLRLPLAT